MNEVDGGVDEYEDGSEMNDNLATLGPNSLWSIRVGSGQVQPMNGQNI
jgi:hypothetical protein